MPDLETPETERFIDVKDCGAVGDGVTDDRDAIAEANERAKATGKNLRFSAGTYLISSGLVL